MLRVILAEAEVELAPPDVAGHPAVRTTAREQGRKPGEVLLDQNVHHQALRQLLDGARRGRPDILHHTLLALLESPLNKAGNLQVAVHTRHDLLIRVRPDTRLPRGEARFHGLLSKVLLTGATHDKDPLLWVEDAVSPSEAVARVAKGPVLRLDEGGPLLSVVELARRANDGELTLVLGAFPAGAFRADWVAAAPEAVSIWPQPLNAWAVAAEAVAGFRLQWGEGLAPESP